MYFFGSMFHCLFLSLCFSFVYNKRLCYVMLCYVMLCYVMLCYVQLLAIYMRLGNCLGSCDRYLKCHSAQAVSYIASQKLGNLTGYRVIGSSAIVPVTIIVKLLNSACRMMVCITLFGN